MRVLIADKLPAAAIAALEEAGCEVGVQPGLKDDALLAELQGEPWQAIIVRSTKVSGDMLRASTLGLVVRAGAGFNTIDVSAASDLGIFVANCPGRNSLAVAELAIGLLICVDRRIPDAVADLRAGRWNKAEYSRARGLAGRTLAVVGAGRIGLAVARRARGLGMAVVAWNVVPDPREELAAMGATLVDDLHEALACADAVTLHLAAVPATVGFADRRFFEALPEGAYFINTSRAEVVDQEALLWATRERGLRAGLDVFDGEVAGGTGSVDEPLLNSPNIWATPHIGASTEQAQEAVAEEAVRLVLQYRASGRVNSVNEASQEDPGHLLIVRHRNEVGVLAHVFTALKDVGINVAETENIVFKGESTCLARLSVSRIPSAEVRTAIAAGCDAVLSLDTFSGGASL
jgi:D-3-phosphoglycerate dehydrogenase